MRPDAVDLLTPRILIVDDERQIHASIRLRLGRDYDLSFCFDAQEALERLRAERFDLCLADLHMPRMNGLSFIAAAQHVDPCLGFVIVSAFDSDENLRRAIPLPVFDFISKPLPEREGFEARVPEWIERTREKRRSRELADQVKTVASDLASARTEREVEIVASETARDALLQTANLLTTIHAHLVTAHGTLAARARGDATLSPLLRNLEEARKTADAAMTVAEGFFNSAYAQRDASPALLGPGVRHALQIALRATQAEARGKAADLLGLEDYVVVHGLTGIEFLLLLVPALSIALGLAGDDTTVRLEAGSVARLEHALRESRFQHCLWVNRRGARLSQAGVVLSLAAQAPAPTRAETEAWLRGEPRRAAENISARGLVAGLQKAKGVLALGVAPAAAQFSLALFLPTEP
jgi:CheY-like chemotaxis protein